MGLAHEQGEQLREGVMARQIVGAVGDEQEDRIRRERAGQEAQQVERGGVGPLEVIEEERERLPGRRRSEEAAHLGEELPDAARSGVEGGGDERKIRRWRKLGAGLGPWAVGGRVGEIVAAPDEYERTLLRRLPAQRLRERRLADPRLTADQDEAPPPGEGGAQMVAQDAQFALTPNEGRPRGRKRHVHMNPFRRGATRYRGSIAQE